MSDASADTLFGPCDTGGLTLAPADDQPFVPRPRSSAGLELNREVGRVVVAWRSYLRMDVAYDYEAAQVVLSCVLGDDRRVDRALTTLIDLGVVDLTTDDGISAALGTNVRLRPVRSAEQWHSVGAPRSRPRVSKDCRDLVVSRDQGRCRYCHVYAPAGPLDHVVPHVVGGPTNVANLVLACVSCNSSKRIALWIPHPINGVA